jgi:hypothetical protein
MQVKTQAAHALLSPSGASRWMVCTPSARFEELFEETSSKFADEGTLAHRLGELIISYRLGDITKTTYRRLFVIIEADEFYSESMLDYCEDYATYVLERYAIACKRSRQAQIFIEYRLDVTKYIPEGFGTSDVVIVADTYIETIDLKYGKGVPVFVKKNKQQMIYALGAITGLAKKYNITKVRMTVYQPRIENIDSDTMYIDDLYDWAETELKTKAALAFEGLGEYVPGTHCQFCRGRATCRKLAEMNLELAKYDFAPTNKLEDDDISDILSKAAVFTNWISAVQEYALKEAMKGKKWDGFKLVKGRSNRKYGNIDAIATRLLTIGFDEENIFTKKLLPIKTMESEIGIHMFEKVVSPHVIKPDGKLALVVSTDKRPEYNSAESAAEDFKEPIAIEKD